MVFNANLRFQPDNLPGTNSGNDFPAFPGSTGAYPISKGPDTQASNQDAIGDRFDGDAIKVDLLNDVMDEWVTLRLAKDRYAKDEYERLMIEISRRSDQIMEIIKRP